MQRSDRETGAGLKIMAEAPQDYLSLEDRELLGQCRVDCYRASGPGGQKRNKIESAIRLSHQPTGVIAVAEESRSQHENKARALRRLRRAIAFSVRRAVSPQGYRPSDLLRSCMTRDGRIHLGRKDQRYNAVVWEILDVFFAVDARVSVAADLIGVNTAHLSKFMRDDPALWRRVNEMRQAAGRKTLK
jgi:hypothetical protein